MDLGASRVQWERPKPIILVYSGNTDLAYQQVIGPACRSGIGEQTRVCYFASWRRRVRRVRKARAAGRRTTGRCRILLARARTRSRGLRFQSYQGVRRLRQTKLLMLFCAFIHRLQAYLYFFTTFRQYHLACFIYTLHGVTLKCVLC